MTKKIINEFKINNKDILDVPEDLKKAIDIIDNFIVLNKQKDIALCDQIISYIEKNDIDELLEGYIYDVLEIHPEAIEILKEELKPSKKSVPSKPNILLFV